MANYAPPIFFHFFWQILFWIVSCVAVLLVNTILGLIPQKICFLCLIELEMFKKLLFDVFGLILAIFFPKNLLKSMGNLYLGYYQHCHALILIWNGFWVILWLGQIWKSHYFNRGGIPGHWIQVDSSQSQISSSTIYYLMCLPVKTFCSCW